MEINNIELNELKKNLKTLLERRKKEDEKNKEDFLNFESNVLEELNELFCDLYEEYDDAQFAFDELNSMLDKMLEQEFVYSLSDGGEWEIVIEENIPKSILNKFLKTFKVKDIDDLCATLTRKVKKTMCNVRCDANSAFQLEKEDFPIENIESFIYVYVPEGNPYLSYLDELF